MPGCRKLKIIRLALWVLMLWNPSLSAREMIILTCEEPPTNYSHEENIVGTSVDIVQAWQEAFEALKTTDFMDKTAQKWSATLGYPIVFDNEKGFVMDTSP
jgi:hypothetical protein